MFVTAAAAAAIAAATPALANAAHAAGTTTPQTPGATDAFSIGWQQFGAGITAVGALGMAAFGVTEALGKALAFSGTFGRMRVHFGLPYSGLNTVRHAIWKMVPALKVSYGDAWFDIIAQQYRSDRSKGLAPDTIRQGVKLGLPFLGPAKAAEVIQSVWDMPKAESAAFAAALQAPGSSATAAAPATPAAAPTTTADPQALAGRFASALDARITAAFAVADERYETQAKLLAGIVAVALSLVFNYYLGPARAGGGHDLRYPWELAAGIGLIAVPLAPVAKDLSTSLQNALTAFKQIPGR